MARYDRHMNQTLTYWAPSSATGDVFGKKGFAAPVTYACRWEDEQELIVDKTGQEVQSDARIFVESTFTNPDHDGYVYLGTSAETDPRSVDGAREVKQIAKIPDLRNMQTLRVVYL